MCRKHRYKLFFFKKKPQKTKKISSEGLERKIIISLVMFYNRKAKRVYSHLSNNKK
jgi:hypothetical protein